MAVRSQDIAQTVTAIAAAAACSFFRAILIPLVLAGVLAVLVNGPIRFVGGHSHGRVRSELIDPSAIAFQFRRVRK